MHALQSRRRTVPSAFVLVTKRRDDRAPGPEGTVRDASSGRPSQHVERRLAARDTIPNRGRTPRACAPACAPSLASARSQTSRTPPKRGPNCLSRRALSLRGRATASPAQPAVRRDRHSAQPSSSTRPPARHNLRARATTSIRSITASGWGSRTLCLYGSRRQGQQVARHGGYRGRQVALEWLTFTPRARADVELRPRSRRSLAGLRGGCATAAVRAAGLGSPPVLTCRWRSARRTRSR